MDATGAMTHRVFHSFQDDRLLVIVGPCSIHDPKAARVYAHRLQVTRMAGREVYGLRFGCVSQMLCLVSFKIVSIQYISILNLQS